MVKILGIFCDAVDQQIQLVQQLYKTGFQMHVSDSSHQRVSKVCIKVLLLLSRTAASFIYPKI